MTAPRALALVLMLCLRVITGGEPAAEGSASGAYQGSAALTWWCVSHRVFWISMLAAKPWTLAAVVLPLLDAHERADMVVNMGLPELQASVRCQCYDNWPRQLAEPEFSRAVASDQTRGMDVFALSALGSASKTHKQRSTGGSFLVVAVHRRPQSPAYRRLSVVNIGRAAVRRLAEHFRLAFLRVTCLLPRRDSRIR